MQGIRALIEVLLLHRRLPRVQEQNVWKIDWQPSLIFTGLTATSTVRVTPDVPVRGRILDRSDKPLADNGATLVVGAAKVKDSTGGLARVIALV